MAKRKGRGRPSSIDLLPEDLRVAINTALRERRLTQKQILDHFNELLEGRGAEPISKSALNRYALHIEETGSKLREAREAAAGLVGGLGESSDTDLGRAVTEMIKTMVFDAVLDRSDEDEAGPDLDRLKTLSIIVEKIAKASKLDSDREFKIREHVETQVKKAAAKEVDNVGKEKGLSTDTISAIKTSILGIRVQA
ncbi:DUF3486 family protein [Maridesulfovibrio sp.]|uniref:DUF3486 family protein n=1 Tax=Maridesulfovibrio sp. TaxID=2795000 RepID=UPI0029C9DE64|nr:DUF3486 family protein [Maridesulfovibrio sp.]